MKKLLENPDKFYNPKKRPSGHDIGRGFWKKNKGAIPSNLLQIPNSESNGTYLSFCKDIGVKSHPARFPTKLPEFFIRFLTDPEDIVVDIFSGSNTTGCVAESEKRNWYSFDSEIEYVASSSFRFLEKGISSHELADIYNSIKAGNSLDLSQYKKQITLFREEAAIYQVKHNQSLNPTA